jgi:ribosomal protein S27AE
MVWNCGRVTEKRIAARRLSVPQLFPARNYNPPAEKSAQPLLAKKNRNRYTARKGCWESCQQSRLKMPRKQKIDRDKVNAVLNTQCPKCGYLIPPSQVARVDFEHVKCPECGERFIPG